MPELAVLSISKSAELALGCPTSAAFDFFSPMPALQQQQRVPSLRGIQELEEEFKKLKAKKIHPKIVAVVTSWLQQGVAHIVVQGEKSYEMTLRSQ